MAQREENTEDLPPPPSYEETQLHVNRDIVVTSDEENVPPSVPLLSSNTTENVPGTQTSHQCGTNISQSVQGPIVAPGTSMFIREGYTDGSNAQGVFPIFVCSFCGSRQQFGQMSPFGLPQGPAVSNTVQPTARYIAPPVYVGTPVISNQYGIQGQRPGYPATGSLTPQFSGYPTTTGSTGPQQQQCNVAVHYNPTQETVQTQPVNADSSNTTDIEGAGRNFKSWYFATICIFIFIICVTAIIVFVVS